MSDAPAAAALAHLRDTAFVGTGARLSDIDLPRLGYTIGCGEDQVHAFLDVETSGGGFDAKGRPKALYEPHRAFALARGDARAALVKAGLAYPRWGEHPYPRDSYPRIAAAFAIDPRVALEATSWGIGQILGSNCAAAGYGSAAEMVDAFRAGEEPQLAAAIAFIRHEGLDDELRACRWAAFARGYNGPGYARNGYDVKLAARYAFWRKRPDTPWTPPASAVAAVIAQPVVPERKAVAALRRVPRKRTAAGQAHPSKARHRHA